MLNRRLDLWLPAYALAVPARAFGRFRRRRRLTHVIFLVCDHFEPRWEMQREDQPVERIRTWRTEYGRFQQRCYTSFGARPLHTFFYPPHHGAEHLASLAGMVFDGFGEVELHYHHRDDTAAKLRRDLKAALAEYNRWGLLLESGGQPRTSFGFVHGDWALCNSCGGKFCGVNDELTLLQELGCWGDFTMPSTGPCQTRKINSIYYAVGDARRTKSHDWGRDARVGAPDPPGLFLMQGPLGINWRAPGYPRIENADLTVANWGRPDRIRKWLDCQVHVKGRPDWIFVKLHAHGAPERDHDALFGDKAFEMHRVLNEEFNDGRRYRLHYVTARQAYNIAKAAECGMQGTPSDWLDFRIRPQANSFYALNSRHAVKHCTNDRLVLSGIEGGREVDIRTRVGPVRRITGAVTALEINHPGRTVELESAAARTEVTLELNPGFSLESMSGGSQLAKPDTSGSSVLRFTMGPRCTLGYRAAGSSPLAMSARKQ